MSITDRLDAIEARANVARQVVTSGTTGTPPHIEGVDVDEGIDILAESSADVPALVAALQAVLDLHKPFMGRCDVCWEGDGWTAYPCPTVQAVTAALEAS